MDYEKSEQQSNYEPQEYYNENYSDDGQLSYGRGQTGARNAGLKST